MHIEDFREMNIAEKLAVTQHAKNRLAERGISIDDAICAINNGEIIKEYLDDKPLPSCLVLGKSRDDRPIHVVISKDDEFIYLITAYYPDTLQWEEDYKTRKGRINK